MNNLRLSQLERNKEIVDMKRQLLLQEANNLLLQADITRRESELYQFQDGSRKGGVLKRWNTYSGVEEDRMRIVTIPIISCCDYPQKYEFPGHSLSVCLSVHKIS